VIFWEVVAGVVVGWWIIEDLKAGRWNFLWWLGPAAIGYFVGWMPGALAAGLVILGFAFVLVGRWRLRRRLRPLIDRRERLWQDAERAYLAEHPDQPRMISIMFSPECEEWERVSREIMAAKATSRFSAEEH
jgi:hypothetical protein